MLTGGAEQEVRRCCSAAYRDAEVEVCFTSIRPLLKGKPQPSAAATIGKSVFPAESRIKPI